MKMLYILLSMGLVDDLQRIFEGKMPEGTMLVRITHGSSEVQIYGVNGRGLSIPIDRVEAFIAELEERCVDPQTMYQFGENDETFDVPGFKLPKASRYLREARDIGVQFAEYNKIF